MACLGCALLTVVAMFASSFPALAHQGPRPAVNPRSSARMLPILGTSLDREGKPVGVVAYLLLAMRDRGDHQGLEVSFQTYPGRFSPRAQVAVWVGIRNAASAAGVNADSWAVTLAVPYPRTTVYGDSLSAMVGLAVVALMRGDPLHSDRVITGIVTPNGEIGSVGGLPLKIEAAHAHHLRRVLVPEEHDATDGDWRTPFLMQVSPVGTVEKAYLGLTDRPLPQQGRPRE